MKDLTRDLEARAPYEFTDLDVAKSAWADFRAQHGLSRVAVPLLTAPDGNAKYEKTLKGGYAAVYGLALLPADGSGFNVCRFSTPECRAACVAYAGHGDLDTVKRARYVRTLFLAEYTSEFLTLLMHEIRAAWHKHGSALRVRLNSFSDLRWERICPEIFSTFTAVRFYDYTKWPVTQRAFEGMPPNYHLTQSVSERTRDSTIADYAWAGVNQAVVFRVERDEPLPTTWRGVRVIDGDKSDNRGDDPRGVIVGLRAKGRMRKGEWKMARTA